MFALFALNALMIHLFFFIVPLIFANSRNFWSILRNFFFFMQPLILRGIKSRGFIGDCCHYAIWYLVFFVYSVCSQSRRYTEWKQIHKESPHMFLNNFNIDHSVWVYELGIKQKGRSVWGQPSIGQCQLWAICLFVWRQYDGCIFVVFLLFFVRELWCMYHSVTEIWPMSCPRCE